MDYWDLIGEAFDSVDIYNGPEIFLAGFSPLPQTVKNILAAHWCQSEVNNGGFDQFFSNPTGVLAPEAEAGFRAIGLTEAADIVASAIAMFGPEYPRDREARDAAMDQMPHHLTESNLGGTFRRVDVFDELDERFYEALDGFEDAANAYADTSAKP